MNTETGEIYRTKEQIAAELMRLTELHAGTAIAEELRKLPPEFRDMPEAIAAAQVAGLPIVPVSDRVASLMEEAQRRRREHEAKQARDAAHRRAKRKRKQASASRKQNRSRA